MSWFPPRADGVGGLPAGEGGGGASQCVSASCIFDLLLHRRRRGFGTDHGMWATGLASLRCRPVQAVGEDDLATRGGGDYVSIRVSSARRVPSLRCSSMYCVSRPEYGRGRFSIQHSSSSIQHPMLTKRAVIRRIDLWGTSSDAGVGKALDGRTPPCPASHWPQTVKAESVHSSEELGKSLPRPTAGPSQAHYAACGNKPVETRDPGLGTTW
jgi:hypothetical protein